MKAKLKYGIASYSGTIDDITFASYKDGAVCIARKYVSPTLTDQNGILGDISKNLSLLYAECSEGYKSDLRSYADLYGREITPRNTLGPNAYGIFIKMMYSFAEASGEAADLSSITYSDIQTLFLDVSNVAAAVDAGYLPKVSNYALLDSTI